MTRRPSRLSPGTDHQKPIRTTWRQAAVMWGIFAAMIVAVVAVGILKGWRG